MENSSDEFGNKKCHDARLQEDKVVTEEQWLQKWLTKILDFTMNTQLLASSVEFGAVKPWRENESFLERAANYKQ
ncbi:Thiopurine S-methyltransferase [Varanus komodoensis]|nr:Thiopurine S-methyltransferase [Varanus komodoensis]